MANEPWRDFLGIYLCNIVPIGGAFLIPMMWPLLFATLGLDCIFLVAQILAWRNEPGAERYNYIGIMT